MSGYGGDGYASASSATVNECNHYATSAGQANWCKFKYCILGHGYKENLTKFRFLLNDLIQLPSSNRLCLDLIGENRVENGPLGNFLWNFLCWPLTKEISVQTTWRPFSLKLQSGEYMPFELHLFCYLAPIKHCAEAIQLSGELSKVLKQLPWTFSSLRTRLRLRRLWSEFKGALWPLCFSRHSSLGLESPLLMFDVTLWLSMLWRTVWCWFCWNRFLC